MHFPSPIFRTVLPRLVASSAIALLTACGGGGGGSSGSSSAAPAPVVQVSTVSGTVTANWFAQLLTGKCDVWQPGVGSVWTLPGQDGRFRASYVFRSARARNARIKIRALVRHEGAWPFEDGVSNVVTITVHS